MHRKFVLVCLGFCLGIFLAPLKAKADPIHRASHLAIEEITKDWLARPYPLIPLDLLELQVVQEVAYKFEAWPMPQRHVWTIVDGRPIVGTPRLDTLTIQIKHKRQTTLRWLTSRYKIKAPELHKWNPNTDFNHLELGQELLVWKRKEGLVSQSAGKASRGKLLHGEPLPEGSNYVILFAHRAFGIYYMVSELQRIMASYAASYPRANPLMIGDLSYRTGRRIKPHISHRSGRDVDITYPRYDSAPDYRRFHRIRRREVNVEETLFLIKRMLDSGMVELLLIDRPIQRRLYNYAKNQGAPDAWLEAVFQYPRHAGGTAIIRNAKGHDDHFHLRFYCQPTDYRCK